MLFRGLQNERSGTVVALFFIGLVLLLNSINVHRENLLEERGEPVKELLGTTQDSLLSHFGEPLHCDTLLYSEAIKDRRYRRFRNSYSKDDDSLIISYWPQDKEIFVGSCVNWDEDKALYIYQFHRKFYYRR